MGKKYAAIVLDLEPDHAGQIPESYEGWSTDNIDRVLTILRRHRVPLSVFVVGKSLGANRQAIARLKRFGAEFHLHSYSHDLARADTREEIIRGIHEFKRHFGVRPFGYRAPQLITAGGYARLKRFGFRFDASIFPSWWPHPRYSALPTSAYTAAHGMREVPNSAIGPMRLLFTLSWAKLVGWPFFMFCISLFGLPENVVFSFHLHDTVALRVSGKLPVFWKFIYSRNRSMGIQLLDMCLQKLKLRNYRFVPISTLAETT